MTSLLAFRGPTWEGRGQQAYDSKGRQQAYDSKEGLAGNSKEEGDDCGNIYSYDLPLR